MKKQMIIVAACCLPLGLLAQKGYTIRGKVGTLGAPAKVYLQYSNDGVKVIDSAVLNNGSFTFKGKISAPVSASLTLKHNDAPVAKYSSPDYLQFYIENSDISVTATDSIYRAVVKGSATNEEDRVLREWQRPYRKSADSLVKVYNSMTVAQRSDSNWKKAAGVSMQRTQVGYDSVNRAFMAKYPKSYISMRVFKEVELAYNFNPDTASARFAKFPESMRKSAAGKDIAAAIEKGLQTNIGKVAMDFEQNDTTGKVVKLSDFRGKYVLVDFWASWCKPCRAENPNLLAAYNKYKDRNFTVLGVSLDDADYKKAWLHAVQQDGLPWTQVSELKGFNSKAAVLYGVHAIPTNYLVDPNGKIIAKNLRGEELQPALEKLLK